MRAQEDGRGPGDIETDIRCGLCLISPALPHPHLPFQQKREEWRIVRKGNNTEVGEEVSSGNSPIADLKHKTYLKADSVRSPSCDFPAGNGPFLLEENTGS